jgi:FkbM family methyltransferase
MYILMNDEGIQRTPHPTAHNGILHIVQYTTILIMTAVTKKQRMEPCRRRLQTKLFLIPLLLTVYSAVFVLRPAVSSQDHLSTVLLLAEDLVEDPAPNSHTNCILPPGTRVTTLTDRSNAKRFDLVINPGDFMSDYIEKRGYWEIREVQDIADLAPGTTKTLPATTEGAFYDVGANIGYYSFLFAAAGYTVVAFEPLPANLAAFRATLCLNPDLARRITLLPVGLSNQAATCRLIGRVNPRTKKYLNGIASMHCDVDSLPACDPAKDLICESVSVTTLDHVMLQEQQLPPPAILKMDIEGHELQVLQGAEKFVATLQPALVQFEFKDPRNEDVASWLRAHRYEVGTLRGHDGNTVARLNSATTK